MSKVEDVLLLVSIFLHAAAAEVCMDLPRCMEPAGTCISPKDYISPRAECPEHRHLFSYDKRAVDKLTDHDEFCGKYVYRLPSTGVLVTLPPPTGEELTKVYQDYDDQLAIPGPDHWRPVGQTKMVLEAMQGKPGPFTIVEIGCNRAWTLFSLRHLAGNGGKLICFDPDPDGQPWRLENFKKAETDVSGLSTEVHFSLFDASKLPPESVDVFISSHCLEHTNDPCAFIEGLDRILKPNAVVFTEVPDDTRDPINKTIWSRAYHLLYFTEHSLDAMMKRHGYEMVSKEVRKWNDLDPAIKAGIYWPWRPEIRMVHRKMSKKERAEKAEL